MNAYRFESVMLGQMAGDSLGLPYEIMRVDKAQKRFKRQGLGQSFLFGKAIVSDDSEHLIFTAQAILNSHNAQEFGIELSNNLKKWFLTLPPGLGITTLKSCFKLLIGAPYTASGLDSMGNGPGMRVAMIAAFFYKDREKMLAYLKASTYITHANETTLDACVSMANLMAYMLEHKDYPSLENLKKVLLQDIHTPLWAEQIHKIHQCLQYNLSTPEYFKLFQLDELRVISGYIVHSMPFSLYCVLRYKNVSECFRKTIEAGGDTDSTCAVVGAILGTIHDRAKFHTFTQDILDAPYNPKMVKKLSLQLEKKFENHDLLFKPQFNYPLQLGRNILAFTFIFCHAIGRLRPKIFY